MPSAREARASQKPRVCGGENMDDGVGVRAPDSTCKLAGFSASINPPHGHLLRDSKRAASEPDRREKDSWVSILKGFLFRQSALATGEIPLLRRVLPQLGLEEP